MTRSGIEPTTSRLRGERCNHRATATKEMYRYGCLEQLLNGTLLSGIADYCSIRLNTVSILFNYLNNSLLHNCQLSLLLFYLNYCKGVDILFSIWYLKVSATLQTTWNNALLKLRKCLRQWFLIKYLEYAWREHNNWFPGKCI